MVARRNASAPPVDAYKSSPSRRQKVANLPKAETEEKEKKKIRTTYQRRADQQSMTRKEGSTSCKCVCAWACAFVR